MTDTAHSFQVGDFLSETLVTDTQVWEVIETTAKTVTVRDTRRVEGVIQSPSPMFVRYAVEPDPGSKAVVRRVRKDGTVRIENWSRPLRPSKPIQFEEGEYHYEEVDWSF